MPLVPMWSLLSMVPTVPSAPGGVFVVLVCAFVLLALVYPTTLDLVVNIWFS
jgi:hypothetical protein